MDLIEQERKSEDGVLSVSQAVQMANHAVSSIPMATVLGEVTGFRGPNARSGHCYFQIKDEQSVMSVNVWKGVYERCGFTLRDGLQIQVLGSFDVYKGSGKLSYNARGISLAGEGLLRQRVAELARKLEREGLMEASRKRHIPQFCTRVAVVTSLSGSVIEDVKRTLARRNPLVEIQVAGCSVQGAQAPASIMRALDVAAAARPDCILLVRGGGSFEDLMCFNDEALARCVAACPVPVVTGIGHEPDTSICDMVSDRRQSTPTAAAESVAPSLAEIVSAIDVREAKLRRSGAQLVSTRGDVLDNLSRLMDQGMRSRLFAACQRLESFAGRRCLSDPMNMLVDRREDLLRSEERLHDSIPRALARSHEEVRRASQRLEASSGRLLRPYEASLSQAAASLEALSPLKVLSRGYAVARGEDGRIISDVSAVVPGDVVSVMLGAGTFRASVTEVLPARNEEATKA